MHAVQEGCRSLIITFDQIATEPGWNKDATAQSSILKQKLKLNDFIFTLEVFQTIFGLTVPLLQVLLSKTLDIRKCDERVNSTPNALRATQSCETFNRPYEKMADCWNTKKRHKHCHGDWEDFELESVRMATKRTQAPWISTNTSFSNCLTALCSV